MEPDGILYTFGGQTALDSAVRLEEQGVFEKYGFRVLKTPIQATIAMECRVYFQPVYPEFVTKIVEWEQPDGILSTSGFQTH